MPAQQAQCQLIKHAWASTPAQRPILPVWLSADLCFHRRGIVTTGSAIRARIIQYDAALTKLGYQRDPTTNLRSRSLRLASTNSPGSVVSTFSTISSTHEEAPGSSGLCALSLLCPSLHRPFHSIGSCHAANAIALCNSCIRKEGPTARLITRGPT